jgi:hypothetical protein
VLEAGLLDVGRALDPDNEFLFTWWAPWRNLRQRNIGWRIDYVLASRRLAAGAERAASLRDFGTSDHAPVVVSFGTPFRDAGVGLQPGAQPAGHEAPRLRPSASGAPGGWTGSQADRETRLKPATTG